MGRITVDGVTRNLADVVSFTSIRNGVSVTFADGTSAVTDIGPGGLFDLGDACPWAVCRV